MIRNFGTKFGMPPPPVEIGRVVAVNDIPTTSGSLNTLTTQFLSVSIVFAELRTGSGWNFRGSNRPLHQQPVFYIGLSVAGSHLEER